MKKFGKLTIKKGTVLKLDDKKNIKGGYNFLFTVEEHGNICAPIEPSRTPGCTEA